MAMCISSIVGTASIVSVALILARRLYPVLQVKVVQVFAVLMFGKIRGTTHELAVALVQVIMDSPAIGNALVLGLVVVSGVNVAIVLKRTPQVTVPIGKIQGVRVLVHRVLHVAPTSMITAHA
jgi:hypothetical protein